MAVVVDKEPYTAFFRVRAHRSLDLSQE